jgi:hypothetical protein
VPSITDVSREKKGGNVFLNQFSTKNAWAAEVATRDNPIAPVKSAARIVISFFMIISIVLEPSIYG